MLTVINLNGSKTAKLQEALKTLNAEYKLSDNEFEICKADKLILPGYGAASAGIKKIHLLNLFTVLRVLKKPLLGIGLGMEILCDHSAEGNISCLGILKTDIVKFDSGNDEIPFHGLHPVELYRESAILKGIASGKDFYFDNSYYFPKNEYSTALSRNKETVFSAAVEKNNFYGVQFHPEESGEAGLQVLDNFIKLEVNR